MSHSTNDLRCHYCKMLDNKDVPAHVTLHDRRGCVHTCLEHAKWRLTTSWLFGHSSNCPHHKPETP